MKDNEREFNYLTKENNVTITHCSSSVKNCPINNILLKDRKKYGYRNQIHLKQ